MPSKSKTKGNAFENHLAKSLNEMYNTEEFARVPLSGAFMGRSNAAKRKGIAQEAQNTLRGDLITPHDFPFVIECKSYNDNPLFHKIMEGKDVHLDKWIAEVEFDAAQADKDPLLFFKVSRKGTFAVIPFNKFPNGTLKSCMIYQTYVIISFDQFQQIAGNLYAN